MEHFTRSFLLLQHEGYLFRSALLTGLNSLRNANVSDPGNFYTAFFQLSIGIERVLKSTLVVDHIARMAVPLSNEELRHFKHDIESLIQAVAAIPGRECSNPLLVLESSSVETELISFLAEFAKTTRYYNLDTLSAGRPSADPLPRWNALLQRLVRENVSSERVLRIVEQSAAVGSQIEAWTRVLAHDFDGTPLDVTTMLAVPRLQDIGCRYAVWHVIKILNALRECLWDATLRVHATEHGATQERVPYMYEFLNFAVTERKYVLQKRRWP